MIDVNACEAANKGSEKQQEDSNIHPLPSLQLLL